MPATQRQPQAGAGKKLGKNLSKPSGSASDRVGRNERNGLLLLSTKKSATAGGLLASKTTSAANRPLPNLNLQTQSNASTHQVLLSAVVGASQVELRSQPDAWGVADKQHVPVPLEIAQMEENMPQEDAKPSQEEKDDHHHDGGSPRYETEASWDEYGGRGVQSGKTDEQYSYMSRLAKERADLRRQEEDNRFSEQRNKAAQRLQELDDKAGHGRGGGERKIWDPEGDRKSQERTAHVPESPEGEKEALIHLSSYEDRDRGMRNGSSAPRMLFDPKSGSMVAVKSRDDAANSKRKERKPRQRKERESKADAPSELKKPPRKLKGQKDSMSSEKSEYEKKPKSSSRLPRTCVVLYGRNEKGNLICKDECDGDLGYGCHSVRGGRVRNAEGYQKFVDEHAEIFQKQKELMEGGYEGAYTNNSSEGNGLTLETGFNLEEPAQPLEWVKAGDKIELGTDDSPTLKPTAKEWAPSQAALAAAAAAAANPKQEFSGENSVDSDEDAAEDDFEDDEDGHSGLGFDPLQDMDFMSSPSQLPRPEDAIASVDLQSLSLEPSAFSSGDNATKSNIFAFGSTTWGASGGDAQVGVLDWGNAAGSDNGTGGGLFGPDVFRSTSDDNPASFLSITPTQSWGSSPIPGLNLSAANHDSTDG